jgi:hypothetical protein
MREPASDMSTASFGDARLTRRLQSIVSALSAKPNVGFPMAVGDEAACEGFYRFLRNTKVTSDAILKPYLEATFARCSSRQEVLVLHDTTQFQFGGHGERDGLGTTGGPTKGFFGHFALAVDPNSGNEPVGVLGLKMFSRTGKKYSRATRAAYLRRLRRDPTKESLRWGDLVEDVEAKVAGKTTAIHVMDRESDSYVLLSRMAAIQARYVIRVTAKRKLFPLGPDDPMAFGYENWEDLPDLLEREVALSVRKKLGRALPGRHPARRGRVAKLRFAAKRVRAKRCSNIPVAFPAFLELNAVRVHEVDPPRGEEPVEWLLLTSEPIKSALDVARVVDIYRARWTIEEYFKALKTGCAFEKRQLESFKTLSNALAILIPIACKILLLRNLERQPQSTRTSDLISRTQLDVLREFSSRPPPARATPATVLSAIAALGGHLRNNGPPGWQVLWRGYEELLVLERAWLAVLHRQRSDQS